MPVPMIAPLVGTSLQLFLGIVRMAIEAKELDRKEWDEYKKQIDKEFREDEFPTYDELRKT